jgi:hypothetical protein
MVDEESVDGKLLPSARLFTVLPDKHDSVDTPKQEAQDEDEDDDEDDEEMAMASGGGVIVQHCVTSFVPIPGVLQQYTLEIPHTSGWKCQFDTSKTMLGTSVSPYLLAPPHEAEIPQSSRRRPERQAPALVMHPCCLTFALKFDRNISASTSVLSKFSMELRMPKRRLGDAGPPECVGDLLLAPSGMEGCDEDEMDTVIRVPFAEEITLEAG